MTNIEDAASVLIEIRGIYDGWSVAKMPNGELVNRWPVDDHRHKATQEWIDKAAEESP